MFEVEGIELLANALKHHPSLQSLFVAGSFILGHFALLLFGLLWANNSLFSQGRLEALQLGTGHCRWSGGWMVCLAKSSELGFFL